MTEQEERHAANCVGAVWVLRLVDTYDGPKPVVLSPEIRSVLSRMAQGASWETVAGRMGGEAWMVAMACGRAAMFATTQQFRVPSMVVPLLEEFRNWWFQEAARMRWEVMGLGEDAEFLAALGHAFVEYELANDGGTQVE